MSASDGLEPIIEEWPEPPRREVEEQAAYHVATSPPQAPAEDEEESYALAPAVETPAVSRDFGLIDDSASPPPAAVPETRQPRSPGLAQKLSRAEIAPERAPPPPARPFIDFLNSVVWSDRNKAALALTSLTAPRDPAVLAELKQSALAPLVDMARWRSVGHAWPGFLILARMAGYSDEDAHRRWEQGERDAVIASATGKLRFPL